MTAFERAAVAAMRSDPCICTVDSGWFIGFALTVKFVFDFYERSFFTRHILRLGINGSLIYNLVRPTVNLPNDLVHALPLRTAWHQYTCSPGPNSQQFAQEKRDRR